MRVLVTGASGALGRDVVPVLRGAGHEVRALSRVSRPGQDGVSWVRGDLATGGGLAPALGDVETVVHLASAPYRRGYTREVDVEGTRRLTAAARSAGVRHLLYVSIVGADRVPWGYFRIKVEAEQIVRSSGPAWTVLRATQFYSLLDKALRAAARLPVTGIVDQSTWAVLAERDRGRRDGLTRAEKIARTHRVAATSRVTLGAGDEDFDTLTLHDLRHTAASLAIAGGASVKAVQRLLGHESPTLTLRTYAGLFEDDLDRLGTAMSDAFAAGGHARGSGETRDVVTLASRR